MDLNDFFVQLFESEKKAEQRKQKISEIQQNINKVEAKIKETVEEQVTLKGQLAIKLQKLSEEELNVKWMRNRERTMKVQIEELAEKIKSNTEQLHHFQGEVDTKRATFTEDISKFVASFGLCRNGRKMREDGANEQLGKLKEEETALLEELETLRYKQDEVDDIELEKAAVQEEIKVYRSKVKELENKITSEKVKTEAISKEKHDLAKKPENGQVFKRLQQELESCRKDSLEGLCQALRLEVDQLQRKVWQKQIRKPKVAVPHPPSALLREPGFVRATAVFNQRQSSSTMGAQLSGRGGGKRNQSAVVIIPSRPGTLEAVPTSSSGNTDSYSQQQRVKEETMDEDLDDIIISDDDNCSDDVGRKTPRDQPESFPQTAKRVRFQ